MSHQQSDTMEKPGPIKEVNSHTPEQNTAYTMPPNGGLRAWLQVAGSFFLFFNSWYRSHVVPTALQNALLTYNRPRRVRKQSGRRPLSHRFSSTPASHRIWMVYESPRTYSSCNKDPIRSFLLGHVLWLHWLFQPIFYIEAYAIQKHAMAEPLAFYLVSILNAASVPGRIIPGLLARHLGHLSILLGSAIISGLLSLCWIAISDSGGLIVFAVLYGFFSGTFVALPAVALTTLTPNLETLGTRMGMCSVLCGLGSLCGSPVAGAILDHTGLYLGIQLYSGISIGATGVLLLFARLLRKN
ncbi:major facilitator superfamily domain-containing protein [Aspergillus pseudonomiae]|uniref:Major facilitator superfamily domain-containing protein n=1 Tax=Aspergillus pseudonomiae TaxID=1506151 RepID=A0A5N7DCI3_9EURO|nr:major facilitator superfamily domain-containing protein [Aspergillus pseudonomiae]KAE8404101.1 major facilitator superfamily domain-containing protein [Aspergillus pseudonomiae]